MEAAVSIFIIITCLILIRLKLPEDDTGNFREDDLPGLKKKYSLSYNTGILLTVIVTAGALILGMYLKENTLFDSAIIYNLLLYSVSGISIAYFKILERQRSEEWLRGFVAYLNLSNQYRYFFTLGFMIKILLSLTIIIQVYILSRLAF